MIEDMKKMACFGVAGNFTGHLEQAGEAKDEAIFAQKDKQIQQLQAQLMAAGIRPLSNDN